jgi:hypothetical protein
MSALNPGCRLLKAVGGFDSQCTSAKFVYYSNITGEGFRTLKRVTALVTIKQLARQA